VVNDGRNAAIGVNLEVPRLLLFLVLQAQLLEFIGKSRVGVREPEFIKKSGNLVAVWSRGSVQSESGL